MTPSFLAATHGSVPMLTLLVTAGADVDKALPTGETLLMAAARAGKADAVRLLLDRGANLHAAQLSKGQTALMWATAEGHLETVRLLLDYGAPAESRSSSAFTALMFAAREGDSRIARLLLDYGADVNASAMDGSTALLVATVRGHTTLAEVCSHAAPPPTATPAWRGTRRCTGLRPLRQHHRQRLSRRVGRMARACGNRGPSGQALADRRAPGSRGGH